ncbi:MAG: alcohol dehydrogenase catalytic domain-containing protein [Rhodocyclales bacterium]|nr:alcohol dehydrogenase catalytic domain-containing protein [Rhodocyclales bacterium]
MPDMFAVVAERIGGPEVIRFSERHPQPRPAKNELRIRVAAAGINPIDCARRTGYGRRMMALLGAAKFPLVLGNDFAGVVDAVGPGVRGWQTGDWVFGCKAASRAGTHAEFVTVPTSQVLRLPASLSPEQAAVVPYSFVTAHRLVAAGLGPAQDDCRGHRVLVHGGLGSVGSFAVGLLAQAGASVDVSDRAPSPQDAAARGAAQAFDLTQLAPGALRGSYDAILNCARFEDEEVLIPKLKRGGSFATIVHPLLATLDEYGWLRGGLRARRLWRRQANRVKAVGGERYRWVLFQPDAKAFAALDRTAAQGLLMPKIAHVLDAREAAGAYALMATRLRGKLVLHMP